MSFADDDRYNVERIIDMLSLPTQGGGKRLDCPICRLEGSGAGKLTIGIMPERNFFKCFRCETSGNGIHMYGLFKYGYTRDYIDGDKEVKKKLMSEILGKEASGFTYSNAFSKNETKKVDVAPAPLEERDRTYSTMLRMLDLSDEHKADLRRRGLRDSDIFANGYKSVPRMGFTKIPKDLRQEACDLLGVPGFFKKGDTWSLTKTNKGYFIPARDLSNNLPSNRFGEIQGMQIRFDTVAPNDTRYKWLSTRDMVSGCAAETYAHFVGAPANTILLTEGPLKADIIYRFLEIPIVAVPGVNSTQKLSEMLPRLWKAGVRRIKTAFDMDYATNPNVQESYVKLVLLLRKYGFAVERLLWDGNYKGLDDYLLNVYQHKGGQMSSDHNPEGLVGR